MCYGILCNRCHSQNCKTRRRRFHGTPLQRGLVGMVSLVCTESEWGCLDAEGMEGTAEKGCRIKTHLRTPQSGGACTQTKMKDKLQTGNHRDLH